MLDIAGSNITSELDLGISVEDKAKANFENSTFITSKTNEGFVVCTDMSQVNISNSTIHAIEVSRESITTLESSHLGSTGFAFGSSDTIELSNLRPGFYERWHLHDLARALSVDARHLGLMDIADVHFKITANGPYKLKNGVELDVCGILCKDEIWEFLQ